MKTPYINILKKPVLQLNETVKMSAYVYKITRAGSNRLLMLDNGSFSIGALFTSATAGDLPNEGAYVTVEGVTTEEKRAECGMEIRLSSIKTLSSPKEAYPLNITSADVGCSIDETLTYRDITLKAKDTRKPFIALSLMEDGFREFMKSTSFVGVHTPNIVPVNIARGSHEFTIDYFGKDAYLSKSPQMYMLPLASAFGRVYEVSHAHRAQEHFSDRYLNEYILLSFEIAYANTTDEIISFTVSAIASMARSAGVDIITDNIPMFTIEEAKEAICSKNAGFDLNPTEEKKLCEHTAEKYNNDFAVIYDIRNGRRPMYEIEGSGFYVLYKGLEVASGGLHIADYDTQTEAIGAIGLDASQYQDFLTFHKHGLAPSGGAKIGIQRLCTKMLDLESVKQTSLFVRDIHNLVP